MPRAGPRRVTKYSAEFKLAAVRLSQVCGSQLQAVAAIYLKGHSTTSR
jgi:transposase-like protein